MVGIMIVFLIALTSYLVWRGPLFVLSTPDTFILFALILYLAWRDPIYLFATAPPPAPPDVDR